MLVISMPNILGEHFIHEKNKIVVKDMFPFKMNTTLHQNTGKQNQTQKFLSYSFSYKMTQPYANST